MLKKFIFSFLISTLLLFSFAPFFTVSAQESATWYTQDFQTWYSKVYDDTNPTEIYGERYTAAQVEWIIYGLFAFLLNHVTDSKTSIKCISGDTAACGEAIRESIQQIQSITNESGTGINKDATLASMVFADRPLSGISYTKEKVQNFKLVPEVHAQEGGFGFNALEPIRGLWSASRNFAYGLAVIATLVLAFMIMFRVKISPQVVISVQSAIPKVLLALVAITFSYAIAGFMVDLMYVVIGAISLFLGQVIATPEKNFQIMTVGFFGLGGGFLANIAIYSVMFFWVLLVALFASGTPLINLLPPVASLLIIVFTILIILAAIVLFFTIFKILWLLLKTLTQTYMLVVIGPLQIALGTVAQGVGFGSWIRSLAANLAVYPIVGFLFILSFLFLFYSIQLMIGDALNIDIGPLSVQFFGKQLPFPNATWSPPLTLGESYMPLIFVGVSFVILTIIPKTAEIIQGFLSGKPFAYGTGIGEALGASYGLARGLGASQISKYETGRRSTMGDEYRPSGLTQFLTNTGIIKL